MICKYRELKCNSSLNYTFLLIVGYNLNPLFFLGSSALTYTAINKFLGVDWDELAKTHSLRSESIVTFMKMQEDGTNYLLHGEITQFPQIPEGVLK